VYYESILKPIGLAFLVCVSQSGLAMEKEVPATIEHIPTIEEVLRAIKNDDIEVVKNFIKTGGNINQCNAPFGHNLLHTACGCEKVEVVKELINNGADVNMVDLMLGCTPLHYAAAGGCIDILRILIDNGADVTHKDSKGEMPHDMAKLSFACFGEKRYKEAAELLLNEIERKEIR
jgi:ankyrin repeat protein